MSRYWLEIDASGFEAPCDEGRWLGYGCITAEGDSLEECLESAQVDLIDQDGGEFAIREADSDAMQDAVEKAFMAKYPPEGEAKRSDLNLAAEEQRGRDTETVRGLNRGDI